MKNKESQISIVDEILNLHLSGHYELIPNLNNGEIRELVTECVNILVGESDEVRNELDKKCNEALEQQQEINDLMIWRDKLIAENKKLQSEVEYLKCFIKDIQSDFNKEIGKYY